MAKQDVKAELFYDGSWHDLVAAEDVFTESPITIQQGLSDESNALRPAMATAQLDNGDDTYRTANPMSPLYGKVGRNTPMRISVGSAVRSVTEASRWESDQDESFRRTPRRGRAWTDVQGNGVLARIGQWTEPLLDPMTRQVQSYSGLIGLWTLTDQRDATFLSSSVAGVNPGKIAGAVTLGEDERPGGASSTVLLGTGAVLSGRFKASTNSGYQVSFAIRLPAKPASATYEALFSFTDTVGRRWVWEINNNLFHVAVLDRSGAVLDETFFGSIASTPVDTWMMYRLKVTATQYEPSWYPESAPTPVGITHAYAAATGALDQWTVAANTATLGAWYSEIFGLDDTSVSLTSNAAKGAFNGYRGEQTHTRFARLLTEAGISYQIFGRSDYIPTAMGPQPPGLKLLDLLREIAATEDGLIYDAPNALEVWLLLRGGRYRRTPIVLTPADFPSLPKESEAAADAWNAVTVSNRDGAEYSAEDTTGPLGTQPPPAGIGEQRQNFDVNLADETLLPQFANWFLRRGTVDLPAYPTVEINLAALSPARVAVIEGIAVGRVIEIIGFRENTVRLYVLGWKETIGTHTRKISFTCRPDQQFLVGAWDTATSLWDSADTTLKTGVNTTATALTFRIATQYGVWSQTTPYDVMIAGERMTVTSMGAPALVSGAYDQAATVTRSVNGITKSLSAGEQIHVATPGRWAL